MTAKQVFESYAVGDSPSNLDLRFCPSCGARCSVQAAGGRPRPVCPECAFVHYQNPSPGVDVLVLDNEKVLLARPIGGDLRAGDDIEAVKWFPLAGPIPEMAFAADRHIIERYSQTRFVGARVDPDYRILRER